MASLCRRRANPGPRGQIGHSFNSQKNDWGSLLGVGAGCYEIRLEAFDGTGRCLGERFFSSAPVPASRLGYWQITPRCIPDLFLDDSKAAVVNRCGRYRFGFLFWNPVFDELRHTTLPAGSHGGIPGSISKVGIGLCLFSSSAFVGESRGLAHFTGAIKLFRLRKRLPAGAASYPWR